MKRIAYIIAIIIASLIVAYAFMHTSYRAEYSLGKWSEELNVDIEQFNPVVELIDDQFHSNGDGFLLMKFKLSDQSTADFYKKNHENIQPLPVKEFFNDYSGKAYSFIDSVSDGYYAYKQLEEHASSFAILIFNNDSTEGVLYMYSKNSWI